MIHQSYTRSGFKSWPQNENYGENYKGKAVKKGKTL